LKTIKHILSRYTAFLWALLKPLGAWGIFVIAALDGSVVGLPVDVVVAGYVYQNHARLLLYVFMASAGSAFGSIIIYLIGYKGGEELLRKRIPAERFAKIHGTFEKHPFWSLMFPAMLPPPTPFKLFVLAAAASEMGFWKFLLAIFSGRVVRFLILSLLILKFGPGFVHGLGEMFRSHLYWIWIVLAAGLVVILVMARRRGVRKSAS
jgi:membrane protein YqaA with SNARE-associated domain